MALSGAIYALPIDLFGAGRAGFGVAALTCAYGLMQAFLSPAIGGVVDRFGFSAVCIALSFTPLIGVGILRLSIAPARNVCPEPSKIASSGPLGKDPEAVIVSFRSGDPALADAMCAEIRRLEPTRRHFEVTLEEAATVKQKFRHYRVGLAPVLFTDDPQYQPLRRAALLLAPRKFLAYNGRLERHHLRLATLHRLLAVPTRRPAGSNLPQAEMALSLAKRQNHSAHRPSSDRRPSPPPRPIERRRS